MKFHSKQGITAIFRDYLINIAIMFCCCVEVCVNRNLPNPPCVIVLCLNLEIEALDENIGRWEMTWFTFIYCIFSVLIWWGTASIT